MKKLLKLLLSLLLVFVMVGCQSEPILEYVDDEEWHISENFIYRDMIVRVYKLENNHWKVKHTFNVYNEEILDNTFILYFDKDTYTPDKYVAYGIVDKDTTITDFVYKLDPINEMITGGMIMRNTEVKLDYDEIPLIVYRMQGAGYNGITTQDKDYLSLEEMTMQDAVFARGAILYCITVQFVG